VLGGSPSFCAHVYVGAFEDATRLANVGQQRQASCFAPVDAQREALHDEVVAVLVDDEAGQAVGFGVDEAVGGGGGLKG
jgi:hypothetical protein